MLKIRLRRMGSRHRPYFRIVVSDSRSVPRAAALEELGHYDPRSTPKAVTIKLDRTDHWISNGAKPSATVRKLIELARTTETPAS